MALNQLAIAILDYVKRLPNGFCDGRIPISGYSDLAVLRETFDLVKRGHLKGAFPPNANHPWPDGYEWGYVQAI